MMRAGGGSPHLSGSEVAAALHRLDDARRDPEAHAARAEEATRLAWRPAWAIRSRKGALRAFLEMFRGA